MRCAGGLIEILLVAGCQETARDLGGTLRRAGVLHRLTWLADAAEGAEFLRQDGKFRHAPRPDLVLIGGCGGRDGGDVFGEYAADPALLQDAAVVVVDGSPTHGADALSGLQPLPMPSDSDGLVELVRGLRRAAGKPV